MTVVQFSASRGAARHRVRRDLHGRGRLACAANMTTRWGQARGIAEPIRRRRPLARREPRVQDRSLPRAGAVCCPTPAIRARQARARRGLDRRLVRRRPERVISCSTQFDTSSESRATSRATCPASGENAARPHAAVWPRWPSLRRGDAARAGDCSISSTRSTTGQRGPRSAVYKVEPYVVAAASTPTAPRRGAVAWTGTP